MPYDKHFITTDRCHTRGILVGCDYFCPALLDGECENPEWLLDGDEEECGELWEMYNLTPPPKAIRRIRCAN
ncbi:MAG: hypothetical protein GY757_18745 [bacterium]|nr:hypothetical protein [bacterium]